MRLEWGFGSRPIGLRHWDPVQSWTEPKAERETGSFTCKWRLKLHVELVPGVSNRAEDQREDDLGLNYGKQTNSH